MAHPRGWGLLQVEDEHWEKERKKNFVGLGILGPIFGVWSDEFVDLKTCFHAAFIHVFKTCNLKDLLELF
jgi:hypothetical protein